MKIPDKAKIGFKDYDIDKEQSNLDDGARLSYGRIEFDAGKILISNKYSKDIQLCTFIHEVIHGIDDIFEIGLEEEQVVKLGKGFYQFIKDNPEVFK